jgi:trehalose 6-phosphate phosphatase
LHENPVGTAGARANAPLAPHLRKGSRILSPDRVRPRDLLDIISRGDSACALFVDFDGTLVEIAATPDGVAAPPDLATLLSGLSDALDGALAIVSGRAVADIDERLKPFRGRAAGVHGAEIRVDPDGATLTHAEKLDPEVVEDLVCLTDFDSRILVEDKGASIAIHYRLAEDLAPYIESVLEIYTAERGGLSLLRGRKVFEVMRRHVSKGDAVTCLMRTPAFAGRRPIMIGDDRTDLSAFAACVGHGGWGLSVAGGIFPDGGADFSGPEAVRFWLAEVARRLAPLQETRI